MVASDATMRLAARLGWAFLVGALAMLTFHQSAVGLFHAAGLYVVPPFELAPVGFLGVPKVVNGAFWSGLWGIVLLSLVLPWMRRLMPTLAAGALFGCVVPVTVLFCVVAPLQGQPLAYAQPWGSMLRVAMAHAFWCFGMVVIWQGLVEPYATRGQRPGAGDTAPPDAPASPRRA